MFKKILVFMNFWALSACIPLGDKACDRSVTTTVQLQNFTAHGLTLEICNQSTRQAQTVSVSAAQVGTMNLETHSEKWIYTGGPKSACDEVQRGTAITLTSTSFADVRLCANLNDAGKFVVVERFQVCPTGFGEQTAPDDSCL